MKGGGRKGGCIVHLVSECCCSLNLSYGIQWSRLSSWLTTQFAAINQLFDNPSVLDNSMYVLPSKLVAESQSRHAMSR